MCDIYNELKYFKNTPWIKLIDFAIFLDTVKIKYDKHTT